MGSLLGGTYRLERRLGVGGMSEVYEARHERLKGRYAVKVLQSDLVTHPGAMDRFKREALITSELRHPNIVQVIDFNNLPDGTPYIVMEFVEGRELSLIVAREGALPAAKVQSIVAQMASALAAAHARGVIHRDLKPQNVMVESTPNENPPDKVKILDFGICKLVEATTDFTKTVGGVVWGTPGYMSPEQVRGQSGTIDARTDQFALGCMTYEMLTAQRAFASDNLEGIVYKLMHEPPAPMEGIAPPVEVVVRRALAKNKDDRYASVLEYSRALEAAILMVGGMSPARGLVVKHTEQLPAEFVTPSLGPSSSTVTAPRKRRLGLALAGGALAVAGAAAAVIGIDKRGGIDAPPAESPRQPQVVPLKPAPPAPVPPVVEKVVEVPAPETHPPPAPAVIPMPSPPTPAKVRAPIARKRSAVPAKKKKAAAVAPTPRPPQPAPPAPAPPPAAARKKPGLFKGNDL